MLLLSCVPLRTPGNHCCQLWQVGLGDECLHWISEQSGCSTEPAVGVSGAPRKEGDKRSWFWYRSRVAPLSIVLLSCPESPRLRRQLSLPVALDRCNEHHHYVQLLAQQHGWAAAGVATR